MRTVKCPDRYLVSNHGAEAFARKPGVKVKGRRLHLERGCAEFSQIEIDRVVRRGTNRGRHTGKHRQRRPMNMPGSHELDARITPDDGFEFAGVEQILAVHVPDAGLERGMMQEQQRRPVWRGSQRRVKPAQGRLFKHAMRLSVHAGIQQQQIKTANLNPLIERPGWKGV